MLKNQNSDSAKKFGVLVAGLVLIAIIHTGLQFAFFGTGISGFAEKGVSGFAIGKIGLGEELTGKFSSTSTISKIIIVGEWALLIILALFAILHQRIHLKKEKIDFDMKKMKKDDSKTELDMLYEILQERKSITLSSIERLFNVDKETVMSWCKTLESSDLARIQYPRIGETELIIEEKNEKAK